MKKRKDKMRIAESQAELDFQKYIKSKQQKRFFIPINKTQSRKRTVVLWNKKCREIEDNLGKI